MIIIISFIILTYVITEASVKNVCDVPSSFKDFTATLFPLNFPSQTSSRHQKEHKPLFKFVSELPERVRHHQNVKNKTTNLG